MPDLKLPVKIIQFNIADVIVLTKHRFACLIDRATSSFGPFDVLNREGSQSSAIYGCKDNRK